MTLNDIELYSKRVISKHGFTPQVERGPESLTLRITRRNGEAIGAVTFRRDLADSPASYLKEKVEQDTVAAIAAACRDARGR